MQLQTNEAEPGTIVQVLQKGYLMNGITLRAAKVVVAGSEDEADAAGASGGASDPEGPEAGDPESQGEPSGGEV